MIVIFIRYLGDIIVTFISYILYIKAEQHRIIKAEQYRISKIR